jgi:hypothetical protein
MDAHAKSPATALFVRIDGAGARGLRVARGWRTRHADFPAQLLPGEPSNT